MFSSRLLVICFDSVLKLIKYSATGPAFGQRDLCGGTGRQVWGAVVPPPLPYSQAAATTWFRTHLSTQIRPQHLALTNSSRHGSRQGRAALAEYLLCRFPALPRSMPESVGQGQVLWMDLSPQTAGGSWATQPINTGEGLGLVPLSGSLAKCGQGGGGDLWRRQPW